MNRKSGKWTAVALAASLAVPVLARADGPSTQPVPQAGAPGDDQDFVISSMRVQEMKGITYFFISSKTNIAQLGDHIRQSTEKIDLALKSGQVRPVGPIMIIFHRMMQEQGGEFPLEVGFPVADDAQAPDGFEIKKLDKFRCATVLYSGSMQQVRRAFEAVYNDLLGAGLEPTDETRQSVLLFEGQDSVNNVVMIQVGVR
jgi:effector-binding domain-containing protein